MIILREFKIEDEPILREHLNNPNVARYLTTRIPQPYTQEDARWWINEGSKADIVRAIEYNGVLVGSVGAHRRQFELSRSAEIGYWIAESHWGMGIATKALQELSMLVFQNTDIVRLQAHVFGGNIASVKVLEKVGYRLEGILRKSIFKHGMFMDSSLYAAVIP